MRGRSPRSILLLLPFALLVVFAWMAAAQQGQIPPLLPPFYSGDFVEWYTSERNPAMPPFASGTPPPPYVPYVSHSVGKVWYDSDFTGSGAMFENRYHTGVQEHEAPCSKRALPAVCPSSPR